MAVRDLINNPKFRKLTANTSWMFGERIFQYIVSFFLSVWIARYLGPANLGFLSYIGVLIDLLAPLTTIGLDGVVIRELSKEKLDRNQLLGTAFVVRFFTTSLFIVLVAVLAFILNPGQNMLIILIILSSFGFMFRLTEVVNYVMQEKLNVKHTVIARNAIYVLMTFVRIALVYFKAPVEYFGTLMFFESTFFGLAMLVVAKRNNIRMLDWKFNPQVAKLYLKECWPLLLSSFAVIIYLKMDQVLVKNMLGDAQLGVYAVAVKFSEIWYFIPSALVGSAFPLMVKSFASSDKYDMRIKQLYSVLVWLGIGSIIVNTTISPLFIHYFYGPEFQNASQILAILCIGGLFTSLGYGNGTILLIESHTKLSLVLTIVGALMSIIGGLILTPILGVYGAAISSVLAYLTTAWIAPLFFKASRKLFFLPFHGFIYPFELAIAKLRKQ